MFERYFERNDKKSMLGLVILGPVFGLLYVFLLPVIGVMTLLLALPEYASAKKVPVVDSAGQCMACHSSHEFTAKFRNGERLSVFVDEKDFTTSVHRLLKCTDCHKKISLDAHPGRVLESRTAFMLEASAACNTCHSDEQLKIKPNHAFLANKTNAPPCIECHGSHNVKRLSEWKPSLAGNQYCMTCHQKNITKTLANGEKLSLKIDQSMLKASVHNNHACNDCHTEFSKKSHPAKAFNSKREHSIIIADACKKCHADKFTSYKESIHYKPSARNQQEAMSESNMKTPVCTDCHGFHSVGPKATYDTLSGVPCKKCHDEIFKTYSTSVHGMAKANGQHKAPLCSSCHFAHEVKPASMTERIKTACMGCHKEAEAAHTKWLPNAGLHLSVVACAACHSPNSGKGIYLRLYDQETGKPFTEEQMLKILGTKAEALSNRLSAHGDGISGEELWSIVNQLNKEGKEAKVTFLGKMNVSNGLESHQLSVKRNAVRECESCHNADSLFFKSVTVAMVKADGKLTKYAAKPEVLGSMVSLLSLRQFYVLGSTRLKVLDWIGILMVFGGMSVPIAHITLRVLTSPIREAKKLNKMRKGGTR